MLVSEYVHVQVHVQVMVWKDSNGYPADRHGLYAFTDTFISAFVSLPSYE